MEFFSLAKLGWYAIEPSHILTWILLAAAILGLMRKRAAIWLTAFAALSMLTLLMLPVGNWALRPIENQFPRPAAPQHVHGILVLGQGLSGEVLRQRGVPGIGLDGGSMIAAWELARLYPEARLIFSGGSGDIGGGLPEAEVAERIFRDMGLDERRIAYEAKSRDTWENIAFSRRVADPQPGETWLLVASAFHMPRAMAVARKQDWPMLPWPSDYQTLGEGAESSHLSLALNLGHLDLAAHEWLGLLAYRLKGRAS